MAPEQAEDTHQVDHRADIYSLGCTLYQLLIGKAPYIRDSLIKVLLAHRECAIPSLCEARADVPSDLDAIFRRMMAKSPGGRHQSMTELIDDLKTFGSRAPGETGDRSPISSLTDEALTSFLDQVRKADVVESRTKARPTRDETPVPIAEVDSSGSLSGRTVPRKSHRKLIVTIGGLIAIALLAMVAVPWLLDGNSKSRTHPRVEIESPEIPAPSGESHLVLHWPEQERDAAILEIDGSRYEIGKWIDSEIPNQIRIPLDPGEHNLLIVRPGHEQYQRRLVIEDGQDFSHEPVFQPVKR
jgi:serine/threonine protein kinase